MGSPVEKRRHSQSIQARGRCLSSPGPHVIAVHVVVHAGTLPEYAQHAAGKTDSRNRDTLDDGCIGLITALQKCSLLFFSSKLQLGGTRLLVPAGDRAPTVSQFWGKQHPVTARVSRHASSPGLPPALSEGCRLQQGALCCLHKRLPPSFLRGLYHNPAVKSLLTL